MATVVVPGVGSLQWDFGARSALELWRLYPNATPGDAAAVAAMNPWPPAGAVSPAPTPVIFLVGVPKTARVVITNPNPISLQITVGISVGTGPVATTTVTVDANGSATSTLTVMMPNTPGNYRAGVTLGYLDRTKDYDGGPVQVFSLSDPGITFGFV